MNELSLKLVIMLEYQYTKTFLLKDILQIGLKNFLRLKKLKILFHGHMLLMISMVKNYWNILCKRITKDKSTRIQDRKSH